MQHSTIFGPAFAPLSRLQHLLSLSLHDTVAYRGVEHAIASLSAVTRLTSLEAAVAARVNEDSIVVASPRLLPWLRCLHGLRRLRLELSKTAQCSTDEVVSHLSGLQHLTSLAIEAPAQLPPMCLRSLACFDKLVSLALPSQILDSAAVRVLAPLPLLLELRFNKSDPDADLSHLRSSWTKLTLVDTTNVLQSLAWLPLQQLQELQMCEDEWWDLDASEGLEAMCTLVHGVACTMGRLQRLRPPSMGLQPNMRLQQPCSSLLVALAPTQHHLTSLSLGPTWPLAAQDVQEGAKHLPRLAKLMVHLEGPGVGAFLEALGRSRWLRRLILLPLSELLSSKVLAAQKEALLGLARGRATAGIDLAVEDQTVDYGNEFAMEFGCMAFDHIASVDDVCVCMV